MVELHRRVGRVGQDRAARLERADVLGRERVDAVDPPKVAHRVVLGALPDRADADRAGDSALELELRAVAGSPRGLLAAQRQASRHVRPRAPAERDDLAAGLLERRRVRRAGVRLRERLELPLQRADRELEADLGSFGSGFPAVVGHAVARVALVQEPPEDAGQLVVRRPGEVRQEDDVALGDEFAREEGLREAARRGRADLALGQAAVDRHHHGQPSLDLVEVDHHRAAQRPVLIDPLWDRAIELDVVGGRLRWVAGARDHVAAHAALAGGRRHVPIGVERGDRREVGRGRWWRRRWVVLERDQRSRRGSGHGKRADEQGEEGGPEGPSA